MPRLRKKHSKLARRLKLLRITQTELSRMTGKSTTLINHFCVDGIKTARVAKFYAKILGCAPEELIDFEVRHELD